MAFSLLLLTFFTAFITSTTNAASTTLATAAIPEPTVATVQHEFPAHCFDCGDGVSRLDAATAVNGICDYWWKTVMKPNDAFSSGGLAYIYGWSLGNIALSAIPFWYTEGCGEAVADAGNTFFVNFDRCYYGFMTPIDSCNTGGVNGKQGGYYLDWCANVTINPNPDGCDNSDSFVVDTGSRLLDSDMQVVYHYATDEEHEAAKAAALARDPSLEEPSSTATPLESEAEDSKPGELDVASAATNQKRSDDLICFDGGDSGICWWCSRDTA